MIEWPPALKSAVENVACGGEAPLSVPVPIVVPPSLKVTVPEAFPGTLSFTVAVNVTDAPKVEGFEDEITVVVVDAWFTVCTSGSEVLATKLALPL